MNENNKCSEIISDNYLETEKNLITQPNNFTSNRLSIISKEEGENVKFNNLKQAIHPSNEARKASFVKFMHFLDEYKDDKKMNQLQNIKINKAKTLLYDDMIKKEEQVEEKKEEEAKKIPKLSLFESCQKACKKVMLSQTFSLIATLAIIVMLFIEDVRVVAIHKKYDTLVDIIMLIIIIFIFFEILFFIILVRSYRFSFFFWLDICSFCSLIPDILVLFIHDEYLDYYNNGNSSSIVSLFLGNTQISKTSRASVSGTKAGRLVGFIKTLKIFSVINVGKAYKYTMDKMLKKNESMMVEDKLKELIKLSRRKSINLVSTKDKAYFFKHIHSVLNNPDIFHQIRYSTINQDIINDYYNYVMSNEKDKVSQNLGSKSSKNITNINININLFQNENNDDLQNNPDKKKKLTKFKTITNIKRSPSMKKQICEIISQNKGEPESEKIKKSIEINNNYNFSKKKKKLESKSKTLIHNNYKPQEKAVDFNNTIKENIDAEDENSINENVKEIESKKYNIENQGKENENAEEKIAMTLKENKPNLNNYKNYDINVSKPVIPSKNKISKESLMSEINNDDKICLCIENPKSSNRGLLAPFTDKLIKKKSEEIRFRSSNIFKDNNNLTGSSDQKVALNKIDQPINKDRNRFRKDLMPFTNKFERMRSLQQSNSSNHNLMAKRDSDGFINMNKINQNINQNMENSTNINKLDSKENEINNVIIHPEKDSEINSNTITQHRLSTDSSKRLYFFKNEMFCKTCGGLIVKNYEKDKNYITTKTFSDNHSFTNSEGSSDDEDIIMKREPKKDLDINDNLNEKKMNESKNSLDSNGEENVNFDNLPELKIRYLSFDKMKTPKLALALSKKTTIRVILIILCLLFTEPFFLSGNYLNNYIDKYMHELRLMDEFLNNNLNTSFTKYWEKYFINQTESELVHNDAYFLIGFNDLSQFCMFFPYQCINNRTLNFTTEGQVIFFENTQLYANTRRTQSIYVEFTYIFAIYDISWYVKLGSILNMCRVILVAFMLWIGSFIFLKDVYTVVVRPLEFISKKITIQENNIEKILQFYDEKKIEEEEFKKLDNENEEKMKNYSKILETNKISDFVKKKGLILIKIFGNRSKKILNLALNYLSYKVLSQEINVLEKSKPLPYHSYKAVIMAIKIKGFNELNIKFQDSINEIYSFILNIIDLTLFEFFGQIITINNDTIMAIFDESKYLNTSKRKEELKNSIQPNSMSVSNHDSDNSFNHGNKDLHEEYHSFEGSKSSSMDSSHFLEEENEEIKIENIHLKNMNIFALISAMKIIARVRYNHIIENKLKRVNFPINHVSLKISLESGNVQQSILNTDTKLETIYSGIDIKKCLELNEIMDKYNLLIVSSEKFNKGLDVVKDYSREIITIKDNSKCLHKCKMFAYDIVTEPNKDASNYMEKLVLSKEKILKVRNEHTKYMKENYFDFNNYNTTDPEILFVRPKKLNTFLKYYKHGYKYYKRDNLKNSLESFKYALTLNPTDLRTIQLHKEIENLLNNN